jgi:hypothetical protein
MRNFCTSALYILRAPVQQQGMQDAFQVGPNETGRSLVKSVCQVSSSGATMEVAGLTAQQAGQKLRKQGRAAATSIIFAVNRCGHAGRWTPLCDGGVLTQPRNDPRYNANGPTHPHSAPVRLCGNCNLIGRHLLPPCRGHSSINCCG